MRSDAEHARGGRLRVELPPEDYPKGFISCQVACPVHTDARGYVRAIAAGRFEEAYLIARGPNPFASICGRICGAPCQAACRRGLLPRADADGRFVSFDRPVSIRALKRFACESSGFEGRPAAEVAQELLSLVPTVAADAEEMAALLLASLDGRFERESGRRPVAVIGAGPAGLSAAHDLALMGFRPVVFEREPVPAGMLSLGVPAYRLPRQIIRWEVDVIRALGVEVRCGVTVGRDVSLSQLRREYEAVVAAPGAKNSRSLGIPGERGPGVYGGVDLLRAVALGEPLRVGREVVVIGGGNVAYDVARTVLRQVAWDAARTAARLPGTGRVCLVSLESLEEMPADTVEILEGDEEGIERMNGWGPVEIERDAAGAVRAAIFRRCLKVYDGQRRFDPVFDDASRIRIPCDTVLLAVGQTPDPTFLSEGGEDIEQARPGWPRVDPVTLATTAPGVFVAGDLAHGTRLLIDAVASGKAAARSVYRYLTGRSIAFDAVVAHLPLERYSREKGYETLRAVPCPTVPPDMRLGRPDTPVEIRYSVEEARTEASRCLDCAVAPVFDSSRCVLCGGCADVCPTRCLKLAALSDLEPEGWTEEAVHRLCSQGADASALVAILKDEDRCIRCGLCAMRCPTEAITMERVGFRTIWRRLT